MMTSCFPIIEFIVFTLINLRSNERKFQEGVRLRSRLRVNESEALRLVILPQPPQPLLNLLIRWVVHKD